MAKQRDRIRTKLWKRGAQQREGVSTRLREQSARRHFRRLMNSTADEMLRMGIKASLSGVATIAAYWWHHHR
ncbi:hypothetical protein JK361_26055 [Streptomyces sp. 5-8]|uniref:Transposase n=1 Tax=Streptomyces musisoli TaxID=2802280 RepID=A0ABS1P7G2_9ACTN|nr:hypothetical protein [Streptomyces musisoli]MBL1108010.1 hypothetical protein [Streptomyces musisoli]